MGYVHYKIGVKYVTNRVDIEIAIQSDLIWKTQLNHEFHIFFTNYNNQEYFRR